MADRLYCALNGTTLHDLDARIHLLDVEELAPTVRTVTASRIGGGLHLLRRQREQLSLRVRFLIEEYDIAARHQLLHLVAAWAEAGGVLTLHEDGKRVLRVVCTQYPTMSTLNWLETLSLVFTAFSCPYWEDAAETSFLMPNTSDAPSKLLAVPGDAPENAAEPADSQHWRRCHHGADHIRRGENQLSWADACPPARQFGFTTTRAFSRRKWCRMTARCPFCPIARRIARMICCCGRVC